MSDSPNRIAPLSPDKRRLLSLLLKERGVAAAPQQTITRRSDAGPLPLSFAQQRLWFLDRLEPGSNAYVIPLAVRLSGALDAPALKRAFNEIIRRHESLRTSFVVIDGLPRQVIAKSARLRIPLLDLSALPAVEAQAETERVAAAEAQRAFDLREWPLLRAQLLRVSPDEHVLLLAMHHIVSDAWSLGVLVREVASLYAAYAAGRESPLQELAVQYADYAVWQREWLQGPALDEQLRYWREQLAGAPPVLELPTDHPRPAAPTHRGASETLTLSAGLSRQLEQLSRREGVTLFMTLLAAFDVLLSRYTGQEDLVVGTPIANRNRAETEALIGFFVNTLALRADLSGDPSFVELLGRVREVTLGAYAHQDLPFERLVEELRPERTLARQPLFQVMFNLLNVAAQRTELPGLTLEALAVPDSSSKFDLTLYVRQTSDGIQLEVVYNADLFERERMALMLTQLESLLAQIAARPQEKIACFSLVTPTQRALLPDPARPLPAAWCGSAQQRLSAQASRVPDRVAVEDVYGRWTYRELEELSNQLARHLRANGITRESVVAIYAQRCASLVWALMGTLKAGAAFVILDPSYPARRLIETLRVARPRGWLQLAAAGSPPEALAEFVAAAPDSCRLELPARVSEARPLLSGLSSDDAGVAVEPDDLAYIAFTSGTTGRPAAILGTHRPLSHFLQWHTDAFGLHELDRFSMLSGLSHDPLLRDILTPLWLGATLYVPDAEEMGNPGWLRRWVARHRISVAHLTPAMGQLLRTTPGADAPPGEAETAEALRYLFFGGDLLTNQDVLGLNDLAPAAQVVNFYGTTETPQAMGYYSVGTPAGASTPEARRTGGTSIPVGRGIADVQLLILNAGEQLAGIGEVGEICIRTPYLSRGYQDDEVLTRQRFKTNPMTGVEGDRLYRTGDAGRYLLSGDIEFLGRLDRQVKVRGFRVEPGEVEAVLRSHPGVGECAVVAREDGRGEKQLVAYVVTESGGAGGAAELREHLRGRLPEYLIPSAFVALDRLPLTPNGKLDRAALPAPGVTAGADAAGSVAPRTPVEEAVAGIWAEVLKVEHVGVEEDFFGLGGHSLLATQVVSRVRELFGVEVPLRALFERPTVGRLAALVEAGLGGGAGRRAPAVVPVPRGGALPLSFAQQRLWFLDQLEPGDATYNVAAGVRLRGPLDVLALRRALRGVVARHESLRTSFAVVGGHPRQLIASHTAATCPVADLGGLGEAGREAELRRLAAAEAARPFDLGRGPLLRALLLRVSPDEHVILLTMHHIVSDAWSVGVLVREVGALYAAYAAGRESPLEELPVQYADYAVWQREWLQGEVLDELLGYWKTQLAGAPPALALPTDRPRPATHTRRGAAASVVFGAEVAGGLRELSRREGVTLFMTLLAAFDVLLSRYAGAEDLVVGTPIANRNRAETEGLIGFFVNMLALRADLSGDPSFVELLGRVREACLGAYAHQDLPFERLVEELRPERGADRQPLFQAVLVLQNAPQERLALPGLELDTLGIGTEAAKYDLTLTITEAGGGLRATLRYDAELFEAATARRLLGHFETLLGAVAADAARRLSELPLLDEEEERRLLVEWNDTSTPYPSLCVHEVFAEQAARTPEAVAVSGGGERLTYAELEARSNQLAHYLRSLGVGPEVCVGVMLERSVATVVGLLGVLKAGGAYVPLDTEYPLERLAWMMEDAGVRAVVTESGLAERLPVTWAEVVCLDAEWGQITAGGGDATPLPGMTPDGLAYVMYTSGSTGRPKGVGVTHRGVVRLARASNYIQIKPDDVLLHFAPASFDASTFEIWAALLNGAQVAVADPGALSLEELVQQLRRHQVTTLWLTAPLFHQIVDHHLDDLTGLRNLLAGGDVLSPRHTQRAQQSLPGCQLINGYGPTENTTFTCCERVGELREGAPVPVGRPISNTQVYVLDRHLRPVPVGAPGELYAGGDGLARGYLNRPDLTAERFVPDPLSGRAGARLYRTGDRARWTADGRLEFLGRIDRQVKVRGFRVEPGEVEAALLMHPGVRECAVVAREAEAGGRRLVAYVVARDGVEGGAASAAELREYLRERLPDYLVPAAFVALGELPLTPNGKVDRAALPAPERADGEGGAGYVAPRTPLEEGLVAIWAEVLGLSRVGVEEDFFELGGHSLLATQVVSRVRQVFGVEVPLRALFERTTIARLAEFLEEAGNNGAGPQTPPITPVPRRPRQARRLS